MTARCPFRNAKDFQKAPTTATQGHTLECCMFYIVSLYSRAMFCLFQYASSFKHCKKIGGALIQERSWHKQITVKPVHMRYFQGAEKSSGYILCVCVCMHVYKYVCICINHSSFQASLPNSCKHLELNRSTFLRLPKRILLKRGFQTKP